MSYIKPGIQFIQELFSDKDDPESDFKPTADFDLAYNVFVNNPEDFEKLAMADEELALLFRMGKAEKWSPDNESKKYYDSLMLLLFGFMHKIPEFEKKAMKYRNSWYN